MTSEKPRRLGRGLEALISGAVRAIPEKQPASTTPNDTTSSNPAAAPGTAAVTSPTIPIASIVPNPFQPRKEFKPDELKELEDSIRANGLLQPISVRTSKSHNGFELAAGERRLRAATNLGWTHIPANIREFTDQELLAVALVENLQRSDLNPLEEAEGYAQLISEFALTQQEVAKFVGKDRSTVANMLRLLNLPPKVLSLIRDGSISTGHARALLALTSETEILALASEITSKHLSVRDVEQRVRVRKPTPTPVSDNRTDAPKAQPADTTLAHLRKIEDQLRKHLQTDSKISMTGAEKGTITMTFYSPDDLERLLDLLLGRDREYR